MSLVDEKERWNPGVITVGYMRSIAHQEEGSNVLRDTEVFYCASIYID